MCQVDIACGFVAGSEGFIVLKGVRSRGSLDTPTPALGPGRVLPVAFPLGDPLFSPASAAPPRALFDGFAVTTGSSDFHTVVHHGITALADEPIARGVRLAFESGRPVAQVAKDLG